VLQEKLRTRASELLRLGEWVEAEYGYDPWWACYCFDSAVTRYGLWIENMLARFDDEGRPVHTLGELLADDPARKPHKGRPMTPEEAEAALMRWFG